MTDAAAGVLITRPEPGASETAARVAALGYQPIGAPTVRDPDLACIVAAVRTIAGHPGHQRQCHPGFAGEPPAPATLCGRRRNRRACPHGRVCPGGQRRWRRHGAGLAGGAALRPPRRPAAARFRSRSGRRACGRSACAWLQRIRRVVYITRPVADLPRIARDAFTAGATDRRAVLLGGNRAPVCSPATGSTTARGGPVGGRAGYRSGPPPWHYRRSPGDGFSSPLSRTRMRCSRCCDE